MWHLPFPLNGIEKHLTSSLSLTVTKVMHGCVLKMSLSFATCALLKFVVWIDFLYCFVSNHCLCMKSQLGWYTFQDQPKLSPLPQVRPHKSSPRRVSNKHEVYISPHRTTVTKTTPKGMSYCINKSPARVRPCAGNKQKNWSMSV